MFIFHYTFVEASCEAASEMISCLTSYEVPKESPAHILIPLNIIDRFLGLGDANFLFAACRVL